MWFILAIVALLMIDLILFVNDRFVWSFFVFVGTAALAYFFVPEVNTFVNNTDWITILSVWTPIYFCMGAFTAVIKWILFNRDFAKLISQAKTAFFASTKDEILTPLERRKKFVHYWNSRVTYGSGMIVDEPSNLDYAKDNVLTDIFTPRAMDHVDRISFWTLQWPIVIVAAVVDDLIINFGQFVARMCDSLFNKLSRIFVGKALKDL